MKWTLAEGFAVGRTLVAALVVDGDSVLHREVIVRTKRIAVAPETYGRGRVLHCPDGRDKVGLRGGAELTELLSSAQGSGCGSAASHRGGGDQGRGVQQQQQERNEEGRGGGAGGAPTHVGAAVQVRVRQCTCRYRGAWRCCSGKNSVLRHGAHDAGGHGSEPESPSKPDCHKAATM